MYRARASWWLAAAVLMACPASGCGDHDAEHLSRIASKLAAKFEPMTVSANDQLAAGLRSLNSNIDELAVDLRIAARLRWDKEMTGAQVQIVSVDGAIELRGKVKDLSQRRRAVELAESTIGASDIKDKLEMPAQEP